MPITLPETAKIHTFDVLPPFSVCVVLTTSSTALVVVELSVVGNIVVVVMVVVIVVVVIVVVVLVIDVGKLGGITNGSKVVVNDVGTSLVGNAVGEPVGDLVGEPVGNMVGNNVGTNVGENVGTNVGGYVGTNVGLNVGLNVGAAVDGGGVVDKDVGATEYALTIQAAVRHALGDVGTDHSNTPPVFPHTNIIQLVHKF